MMQITVSRWFGRHRPRTAGGASACGGLAALRACFLRDGARVQDVVFQVYVLEQVALEAV